MTLFRMTGHPIHDQKTNLHMHTHDSRWMSNRPILSVDHYILIALQLCMNGGLIQPIADHRPPRRKHRDRGHELPKFGIHVQENHDRQSTAHNPNPVHPSHATIMRGNV